MASPVNIASNRESVLRCILNFDLRHGELVLEQKEAKKWTLFGREMDIWQVLVGILFLVYITVILKTFTEYGITIDEPPQAENGKEIVKWYLSLFQYEGFFTRVKTLDLERYGGFFDTVLYPITRISPLEPFDTRHLCYALLGLLGLAGVYRLGATIGTRATGFWAALFLCLTPRFYGHTFNNPKDLPFAIFYIWSIYFVVRCLGRLPNLPQGLIWATGLAIGLTLGTRVGGLILFGYLGLFFVLRYVQIGMQQKEMKATDLISRGLFQVGAIALIAWLTMLIFWPNAQRSPLFFPIDALVNFSQYGTPDFTTTFFEGKRIDITAVPWYYAPLWLFLALPEFLFLGLVAGAGFLFARVRGKAWARRFPGMGLEWGLIGFSVFFPLVYVVIVGTPLYDGLRHFLFVIPPLAVLSAAGVEVGVREVPARWMRRGLIGITGVLLALTLWDMVRLHPNEVVYFNRLVGGGLERASKSYPTDYWENSHKQGVRWLDANYEQTRANRKLRISAGGANIRYVLNPDRYTFTDIPVDADSYLSITRDDRHRMVPGEIVHTIERDGVAMLYIIRPDSTYNNDPFFAESEDRGIHMAWKYMQAGAFEQTLETYQQVLENDPQNSMIYHNVAYAHYRLGHYSEAVDFSTRALALKPDYLKARLFLGHALLAKGDAEAALEAYGAVLQLDPNDPEVHQGRARGFRKLGRAEESIQAYEEAIRVQPDDVGSYRSLGGLLAEQGRFSEAGNTLQKAASLDSTQAVIWYMLAQTRRLDGALDLAHRHIFKAIAHNPSASDYRVEHLNVARAYQRKGEEATALLLHLEAAKLSPPYPEAHIQLGIVHLKQDRYSDAISVFERAVQIFPRDPRMPMGLAQAFEKSGQIDAAVATYRKVLSLIDSPEVRASLQALLAKIDKN
jgi:tetratricopeptide (TPR) repeat protein